MCSRHLWIIDPVNSHVGHVTLSVLHIFSRRCAHGTNVVTSELYTWNGQIPLADHVSGMRRATPSLGVGRQTSGAPAINCKHMAHGELETQQTFRRRRTSSLYPEIYYYQWI